MTYIEWQAAVERVHTDYRRQVALALATRDRELAVLQCEFLGVSQCCCYPAQESCRHGA